MSRQINWWFTADTHFDHPFISGLRKFNSTLQHDVHVLTTYNKYVKPNDVCVIAGDIFWCTNKYYINKMWKSLNGNKIIVKGNHDRWLKKIKLPYKTIYHKKLYDNTYVVVCHYPMHSWKRKSKGSVHLYGHDHTQLIPYKKNVLNINLDSAKVIFGEYKPFSLQEVKNLLCLK